jgi:HPt (histidine-containing phosphotransfer) domain-containing protein
MSDFLNKINSIDSGPDLQTLSKSADEAAFAEIDLSVLIAFEEMQIEGEPDLIVELIDLYLADVPQRLSAMKDFILKADWNSLKRAAHTLKGSSVNLGVTGMGLLCEKLEQSVDSESFDLSNDLISMLEQSFMQSSRILLAARQNRI